ncbi:hypothetical protein [Mesorhizobium loti]|uniref:Uncharacterized protein n=1 Tax=Mesorhizobium loti R88b TaxID=935548 RepID=A0A6M7WQY1_RHILI|nr:hypothetical protein [Mesorhizobium loti]QKD01481.1 hypothetical protein EB235_08130 [Mesorhizobium loti R88b]
MSLRLVQGLVFGNNFLPQFSNTKQRVLSVDLEMVDGKPARIGRTEASIWTFDSVGGIRDGLHKAMALVMDSVADVPVGSTVVPLRPRVGKKKLQEEFRWEPLKGDIERVIADVWPKQRSDRLKAIEGATKRSPPLTFEARHALDEISGTFWKISSAIEGLKGPSQKALAFEARKRAQSEPEYSYLYGAIAEMSDWHLEVEKRHRTGKGVWYALLEVLRWEGHTGDPIERFHERCESRGEAIAAARRLLALHADKFGAATTVEAETITDLEWQARAYPE